MGLAGQYTRNDFFIRPMQAEDIPRLVEVRPGFISETLLKVEKTGMGYEGGWQLHEVPLDKPYEKGAGYDFDAHERQNILERLTKNNSLEEVLIESETGRITGVLDVAAENWRRVAWIWNIMLDVDARGLGIGQEWVERTIAWARQRRLRAVMLETQTNNVPACKFYQQMGFQLVGIHETFYSNRDMERNEVALFWSYPLSRRR